VNTAKYCLKTYTSAWMVNCKTSGIGAMMNDDIKIEAALQIEAGKTYAIEISRLVSKDEAAGILKAFETGTGAKAVLLIHAKISREHNENE